MATYLIRVDSLSKSIDFYARLLDVEKSDFSTTGTDDSVLLKSNGTFFILDQSRHKPEEKQLIILYCYDIEKVVKKINAKGIELNSEIKRGPDDNLSFSLKDPSGNIIQFIGLT